MMAGLAGNVSRVCAALVAIRQPDSCREELAVLFPERRMPMKSPFVRMAAAALLAACALPARANMIANGDFESAPVPSSGGYTTVNGGASGVTDWTVGGVNVLLINTNYTQSLAGVSGGTLHFNALGNTVLDITGVGNTGTTDSVTQSVATTMGQSYLLSFAVGYLYGGPTDSPRYTSAATVGLHLNGTAVGTFTNDTPSSANTITDRYVNYQTFTYGFTATGPTTQISFFNATAGSPGFVGLDNVSLVAVPEPASLALGGIGLLGMGAFGLVRRRRARKV